MEITNHLPKWLHRPVARVVAVGIVATLIADLVGLFSLVPDGWWQWLGEMFLLLWSLLLEGWPYLLVGAVLGGASTFYILVKFGWERGISKDLDRIATKMSTVINDAGNASMWQNGVGPVLAVIIQDLASLRFILDKSALHGDMIPIELIHAKKFDAQDLNKMIGDMRYIRTMLWDNHKKQAVEASKRIAEFWRNEGRGR